MRTRYMIWVLVGAIAVVAAAEGSVRALDHRLEEPLQWYNAAAQRKSDEMMQVADAGITSDLTFIGTSMVMAGAAPKIFEQRLASVDSAHNAALPAAQATLMQRWTLEEVVPTLQPARIVWGVSTIDFNGNRVEHPIDNYNEARATRPGLLGAIDRLLDRSALSHHREELRTLSVVDDPASPDAAAADVPVEDLLGRSPSRPRTAGQREAQLKRLEETVVNDYVTGYEEIAAFRSTIETLTAEGIEAAIVFMPIPQTFVAIHPRGAADVEGLRRMLQSITDELGVDFIDMSSFLEDQFFSDHTHLTPDGSVIFSQQLADQLIEFGW